MSSSINNWNAIRSRENAEAVGAAIRDGTMITINVGPQRQVFRIHKLLATKYSPYFRNMLDGSFSNIESTTNNIDWPEEQPEIVTLYTTWMYTMRIVHEDRECITGRAFPNLFRLWVLAERYESLELVNAVSDACHAYCSGIRGTRILTEEDLAYVWENTLPAPASSSTLRCLIVDHILISENCYNCRFKNMPNDFYIHILERMALLHGHTPTSMRTLSPSSYCRYHIHPRGAVLDCRGNPLVPIPLPTLTLEVAHPNHSGVAPGAEDEDSEHEPFRGGW